MRVLITGLTLAALASAGFSTIPRNDAYLPASSSPDFQTVNFTPPSLSTNRLQNAMVVIADLLRCGAGNSAARVLAKQGLYSLETRFFFLDKEGSVAWVFSPIPCNDYLEALHVPTRVRENSLCTIFIRQEQLPEPVHLYSLFGIDGSPLLFYLNRQYTRSQLQDFLDRSAEDLKGIEAALREP